MPECVVSPLPLAERRVWNAAQDWLELRARRNEAPDTATFVFHGGDDVWFSYLPGQAITLTLPLPEGPVQRRFAVSSSPSRPLGLAVTVKATPDDAAARWMLEALHVGARLRAGEPEGAFTLARGGAGKLLLVAAGIGMAPLLSMLHWAEDTGGGEDITLIAFARAPAELLFRAELEAMAARLPGLRLSFVVTGPATGAGWTGLRGRLSAPVLRLLAPDFSEREVFCSGPRGFRRELRAILDDAGCLARRYHEEEWHPETAAADTAGDPPAAQSAGPETADAADAVVPEPPSVRFVDSGVSVPVAPGQTLLQLAYGAGVRIPSNCTMGLCGTCKVMRLTGRTEMRDQGGIHEDEIAAGFVLACCTWPLGSVEIDA